MGELTPRECSAGEPDPHPAAPDQQASPQYWDQRYRDADDREVPPAEVLIQNRHLLPQRGLALDLACGLGGNAIFLASCGLNVRAWDFSEVAVRRLRERAEERELPILAEVRDVVARPPEPESFEVVVIARFLERSLARALMDSLRLGGLLFYQTYAGPRIAEVGPRDPAYRLRDNELLRMFRRLRVRFYRDEQDAGNTQSGLRGEAMLVAQRIR